jgi:hypothetical protein
MDMLGIWITRNGSRARVTARTPDGYIGQIDDKTPAAIWDEHGNSANTGFDLMKRDRDLLAEMEGRRHS